jgi:hypothetical protein
LRLASCQTKANQISDAEKSYRLAEQIAVQTDQKALESLTVASAAALKAVQHKTGDALLLYQRALQLDASLNDPRTQAVDWYNYGVFLRDAGFPSRLSYACLMKSELLMKPLKEAPELKLVADARENLSKKDPAVSALNSKNLKPVLDEALHFQAK